MLYKDDLRTKQVECIDFIKDGYETMVLADVGTGKTVISLTALLDWFKIGICTRALILAPKRVCTDVWEQELSEWFHLTMSTLVVRCAAGKPEKVRRQLLEGDAHIVLLNYENLPWLLENYPKPPAGFNTLVCDEVDKLKDRTTYRFKGHKWRDKKTKEPREFKGMKHYRDHFDNVITLTGTPTSNHLLDLWAQAYITDGGKALGKSYDKFKREHFYQTDWAGHDWAVLPGQDKVIYEKLKSIVFRIERDTEIPDVVMPPPRMVEFSDSDMRVYKQFARELIAILESGEIIESQTAMTAYGKLLQLTSGFAYTPHPHDFERRLTIWNSHLKFNALQELISELQGQQLMIVYRFKAQLEELQRRYPKMKYLGGGVTDRQARDVMAEWNDGELQLMALHPASAGHGLNLQKSGAHHIAMLTQPDSAGLNEQVIGRLRRTGNEANSVFVHRILTKNTLDVIQDMRLRGKIATQEQFLNEMKKRC